MKALPPAPRVGAVMTGRRLPLRFYRRRPVTSTGRLVAVHPTALEIVTEGGFYLIDPTTAREVRRA